MKKYIEAIMTEWNVTGKTQYPHIKDLFKINSSKRLLDEDGHKSFHRRVGKLIYLAHHCRPDVLCIIYEDNEAAIHLIKNGKSNSDRTKHIALRRFFVKQHLDDGTFDILRCTTEDMIADILTKPLQGPQFFKLRALVLGHAIPDLTRT